MRKVRKITALLLSILLVLSMTAVPVFAGGGTGGGSIPGNGGTVGGVTITPGAGDQTGTITNIGNRIIGILQLVGIFVAVIVLVIIGIKYMIGSAEEKAEYKKVMLPYIIGAILIFAAVAISGMIVGFATGIGGATPL